MFYIYAVQFGSCFLFMATEHLKCGYYEWETEFWINFKILINLSLNNSMWPVVIVLDRVALECWSTLAPNMRGCDKD